jgi:lipid-binding SYLF domain-containing protein
MRNAKLFAALMAPAFVGMTVLPGCSSAPTTTADQKQLSDESHSALTEMKDISPDLRDTLSNAYGWVVFPTVAKGAVGVGAAFGRGEVYEHGKFIGYAELSQGTLGPSIGGQSYKEILVLQNQEAMDSCKANHLTLDANASAVALKAGADASASSYNHGVAVFLQSEGGLMLEASVGAQQFNFQPQGQVSS